MSTIQPEKEESNKAKLHAFRAVVIAVLIFLVLLPVLTSIFAFLKYGVSQPIVESVKAYWHTLLNPVAFYHWHEHWIQTPDGTRGDLRIFTVPIEIALSGGLAILFMIVRMGTNPYSFQDTVFGSARFANDRDIKEMGLADGSVIVLGEWKGKLLKFKETLSVLCVAPPGTGKTVGVVVPTILEATQKTSMIINDVKPELFDLTSGYISKHSFCLKLEWAAQDEPEKGIFYPRWNPLSPGAMPPPGPNRDLYIDRITNIMVAEPTGNADPHWSKRGRAVLAGLIHFIVSKTEAGNYEGIPEEWYGKEASVPMLLDWISEQQFVADQKKKSLDPMRAMQFDPMREFFMGAAEEARNNGYAARAIFELGSIANTPDKERGSILSTMDAGMIVFRNSAVKARTSQSDFSFLDVRGMKDPETGEYKPLNIYVCVSVEDSRALGMITALLVEALSAWLVAHKPGGHTRDGKEVGPCDALFVLDEFPQMPKLQALIDGPAVGRGQRVSYLMIGQDLGQIKAKYGPDETETVISTTAAKVVLPLNNEVTAKRFSEMVGQRTLETRSKSRTVGMSKQTNPFAHNVQRSLQGQPLLRPEDFMSIPGESHYLLYQKYNNRPIKCTTPFYFKNKKFKELVYSPRNGQTKYPPAAPMPEFMRLNRVAEWQRDQEARQTRDMQKAFEASLTAGG
jgi:type IV secretion system protein VirD4